MKGMFGGLVRGTLKLALNAILAYIIISTLVLLLNIGIPELPPELNAVAPPEVKSALYIIGAFSPAPGWIIFAWVIIVLMYLLQCYFERSGAPYSAAQFVRNFVVVSWKRKRLLREIPKQFPLRQDGSQVSPEFCASFDASLETSLKGWPFRFPPSEMFDPRYSASMYDSSYRDSLRLILLDEVITGAMVKHGGMSYLRLYGKNYGKELRDHWGMKLGIIASPLGYGPGSDRTIVLVNSKVCNSVIVEPMLDAMSGMESIINGRADDEELQQYNKAISHLKVLGQFHALPGKIKKAGVGSIASVSTDQSIEEWIADEVKAYLRP